jgi:hypothetical protein
MNLRTLTAVSVALLTPSLTFADFNTNAAQARVQVSQLTQQQLDGLNGKNFSDAFLTAKIIGYSPSDIDQSKADVQQLRQETAELRSKVDGL